LFWGFKETRVRKKASRNVGGVAGEKLQGNWAERKFYHDLLLRLIQNMTREAESSRTRARSRIKSIPREQVL